MLKDHACSAVSQESYTSRIKDKSYFYIKNADFAGKECIGVHACL